MSESLAVVKNSILRTLGQGRLYFALFVYGVILKPPLDVILSFSRHTHVKVTPWVFPFLMGKEYLVLVVIVGVAFLFSDAPFMDESMAYEMIRCGKKKWFVGKMVYIFAMSFIYMLLLYLITLCLMVPNMTWSTDWGRVIGTFIQLPGMDEIGLNKDIYYNFGPIEALLASLFVGTLVCAMVGYSIYAVNVFQKKIQGAILGMFLGFLPYLRVNMNDIYILNYFSPADWMNIGEWKVSSFNNHPTPVYMILFLFGVILFLTGLSYRGFCRKDDMLKERAENEG